MPLKQNSLTISVPCSLSVYQYYCRNGFDALFYQLLRSISEKEYRKSDRPLPDKIMHRLHVPVTADQLYVNGFHLPGAAVIQFNSILEYQIKRDIRQSFLAGLDSARLHNHKFKIKHIIDATLIRLGISEEALSFDTAKKDIQRFCIAKKISYQDAKKVRKSVPKLKANCSDRPAYGIPLKEYLAKKGIGRTQFYEKHIDNMKTFLWKGRRYLHIDNFSETDWYFSELKQ